ncbi:hypothetical protein F5884DRAFT_665993 [Xylogone sp. PMI_703]|nr:hypothetical protein F5884DRAFT_665993 [Xylogone sp. PMI_703]
MIKGTSKPAGPVVPPSQYGHHHLPGFNLPIDYTPRKGDYQRPADGSGRDLFASALRYEDIENRYSSLPLNTLRELNMIRIMDNITDKPNWETKVFNTEITDRWTKEALGPNVTEAMMKWVIEELQYKAEFLKDTGVVIAYQGGVVKSDNIVPEEVKEALKRAVRPLEDTPERDYHPGSDEKVLDLVHPSLFPVIYGQTKILKDELIGLDDSLSHIGRGTTLPVPNIQHQGQGHNRWFSYRLERAYSDKFQWLPCDVDVDAESGGKIVSYINNLRPFKHKELYRLIENIIDLAIPLWNFTLGPVDKDNVGRLDQRICYRAVEYIEYREISRNQPQSTTTVSDQNPEDSEDQDSESDSDASDEGGNNRELVLPEPREFMPIDPPEVDLRAEAEAMGLQVIVKLANIELTPEKPSYDGGSWHVEGQMCNEHICATALYYYDSENITESRLAFRQDSEVDEMDIDYEQGDLEWLGPIFGCESDGTKVQEVLEVPCKEGRLLAFPNILQHRVSPFALADPTKPGHRKILALFLVDPRIRIISTAHVPPQQHRWWTEEMHRVQSLDGLPPELQQKVMSDVSFPIRMEEAKALREELIGERGNFVRDQTLAFTAPEFSFCEH